MSGPIVRKYGFPNFDKIFGEREVEHGVDQPEQPRQPGPEGAGLPPEKAHQPVDPNRPGPAGKPAPATEFGSTSD